MKRMIIAFAISTLLGAPTLAQSYDPDLGSGNVAPLASSQQMQNGSNAFAQAPGRSARWVRTERQVSTSQNRNLTDPTFEAQQGPYEDENY